MSTQLHRIWLALACSITALVAHAQPPNDNCGTAQAVIPNGTCYTGTTVAANDSWIGTVGCAGNNAEVWYSFVATGAVANFQVTSGTLGGNVEVVLVSSTGPCAGLGLEGSVCAPSPVNLDVSFSLVIGNTYYYTISGTGAPGTFTTCVTTSNPPPAPGLDCPTAEALCTNAPFSQGNFTGIGAVEEISQNSCFGLDERQSKWYTFTCSLSGTFQLLVNPVNFNAGTQTGDDFDFSLYDVTNGCYVSTNVLPVPLACNWSGCVGSTGIATTAPYMGQVAGTDYQNNNPAGPGDCLSDQQWVTTAVNLVACQRYALLIDNYSTTSGGFSVAFGGTAIMGPNATFTYTLNPTCQIITVNRGAYCTGPQMTYQWNFGDGYTTTAAVPPAHTYAGVGNYTVSLTVADANGCVDTYSQTVNIGCVPLPIQLLSFDAKEDDGTVLVEWVTATEQDNDHFTVERSRDGVTFSDLGSQAGAGTSSHTNHYSFIDPDPLQGWSYYRLRQTDLDGTSTLSRVVSVHLENNLRHLSVFPQPAHDQCTVTLDMSSGGVLTLELRDMLGSAVWRSSGTVETGAGKVNVDLRDLLPGTYLLRVVLGNEQRTRLIAVE